MEAWTLERGGCISLQGFGSKMLENWRKTVDHNSDISGKIYEPAERFGALSKRNTGPLSLGKESGFIGRGSCAKSYMFGTAVKILV